MLRKILNVTCIVAVVFIWVGFVCSISFMEAWLKFRAPLMTLPVGLSVGRLIFFALNKVEWLFALVIAAHVVLNFQKMKFQTYLFFIIPVAVLMLQTVWAQPALSERVDIVLQGGVVRPSFLHFYYIFMELLKVVCLTVFGSTILRLQKRSEC